MQGVSLFGDREETGRAAAMRQMREWMAVYRRQVQEGVMAGLDMQTAHAAARPAKDQARGVLRAAGMSEVEIREEIAGEFRG